MIALQELDILIRARYPLVYLVTPEEDRALTALGEVIQGASFKPVYVWSVTQGFRQLNRQGPNNGQCVPASQFGQTIPGTISPEAALDFAFETEEKAVAPATFPHPDSLELESDHERTLAEIRAASAPKWFP